MREGFELAPSRGTFARASRHLPWDFFNKDPTYTDDSLFSRALYTVYKDKGVPITPELVKKMQEVFIDEYNEAVSLSMSMTQADGGTDMNESNIRDKRSNYWGVEPVSRSHRTDSIHDTSHYNTSVTGRGTSMEGNSGVAQLMNSRNELSESYTSLGQPKSVVKSTRIRGWPTPSPVGLKASFGEGRRRNNDENRPPSRNANYSNTSTTAPYMNDSMVSIDRKHNQSHFVAEGTIDVSRRKLPLPHDVR